MNPAILGLGTAVPSHRASQSDIGKLMAPFCCRTPAQVQRFRQVHENSGIATRHSVVLHSINGDDTATTQVYFHAPSGRDDGGPGTGRRMETYREMALPLAVSAGRQALDDAGIDSGQIDHLINVTCTGFSAPGIDVALIEELNLSNEVARTQVGFMGCHGVFNALRVASSLAHAPSMNRPPADGKASHVLICATELCSLHFAYGWSLQRVIANALFADGAGAAVIGARRSEQQPRREDDWLLAAHGSVIVPNSSDAMTWRIGDHGFEMTLSPGVADLITTHLHRWISRWLENQGLAVADVQSWAVHPGGPRILDAVAQSLKLPEEALADSRSVLSEFGNMSSPTILFILDRLRRQGAPRPCIALGFGPGLTIEAMLLR